MNRNYILIKRHKSIQGIFRLNSFKKINVFFFQLQVLLACAVYCDDSGQYSKSKYSSEGKEWTFFWLTFFFHLLLKIIIIFVLIVYGFGNLNISSDCFWFNDPSNIFCSLCVKIFHISLKATIKLFYWLHSKLFKFK